MPARTTIINIPPVSTLDETRQALVRVVDTLQKQIMSINPNDGGGQQIGNVAPPSHNADVVTLQYLNQALGNYALNTSSALVVQRGGVTLEDTHANRVANYPAASYAIGQQFYELDRQSLYITKLSAGTNVWEYVAGRMFSGTASLTDVPSDLTIPDQGFLYFSTHWARTWVWDGGTWHIADGGVPGAHTQTSGLTPAPGVWYVADGSGHPCALDNATIGTITAINAQASGTNNPFIMGGTGGPQQAATPTTLSTNVGVTVSVTISSDTDGGAFAPVGTADLLALNPHTHTGTASATVTQPTLAVPNESNGGLPLRVSAAWWMRG